MHVTGLGVMIRSDQISRSLCPTLSDPMNCSTPGLPVHHQLPEFTQTHVHWVRSNDTYVQILPLIGLVSVLPIRFWSANIFLFICIPPSLSCMIISEKNSRAYVCLFNFMYLCTYFLKCLVHDFIFCCNNSFSLHKRFANKNSDFSSEPKHF